jgi:hypothetical protein
MRDEIEKELFVKAHAAVYNALRRGDLVRPTVCSRCFKLCKPQAHHPDYSKPLDVAWLCKQCHTLMHYPERPFRTRLNVEYYKKQRKAYRQKNRTKRREQRRKSRIADPNIAISEKKWRDDHPDQVKDYQKVWSGKHRAERAEYFRKYKAEHREELNIKRREWRRAKAALKNSKSLGR